MGIGSNGNYGNLCKALWNITALCKLIKYNPRDNIDWFWLNVDLHSFFRLLQLKVWFSEKEQVSVTPNVSSLCERLYKSNLLNRSDFFSY